MDAGRLGARFDAALEQHGVTIPRTTLVNVPLPFRTALLAGFALATEDPATATPAMWARTSGMHRAHFRFVLTDWPGGMRFRHWLAAETSPERPARPLSSLLQS